MAKKTPQLIDTSKQYMFPMTPLTIKRRLALKSDEVRVPCTLTYDERGASYKVSSPGYYDKWFYQDLLLWYLDTGYVTVFE